MWPTTWTIIEGTEGVQQSLVCINITEAAADVLILPFYKWKQWTGMDIAFVPQTQSNLISIDDLCIS